MKHRDPMSDFAPPEDRRRRILRERSRRLSLEPREAASAGELDVVVFRLGEESYAVESRWVGEVVPLREVVPLPGTPDFVRGIVNLRGGILSVLDLKVLFQLPRAPEPLRGAVILVLRREAMAWGVVADALEGVRGLATEALSPPLPTLAGLRHAYLRGLTGELILLDGAKMLGDPGLLVNDTGRE